MDLLGWGTVAENVVKLGQGLGLLKDTASEAQTQQFQLQLTGLLESESSKRIEAVNATMQAEAKSEHWAQWSWRPTVGFTFSGVIINNYILLPYFSKLGLVPIVIPGELWTTILVVLGAASAGRSWEKVSKNGK
jgi:hypothetical protein